MQQFTQLQMGKVNLAAPHLRAATVIPRTTAWFTAQYPQIALQRQQCGAATHGRSICWAQGACALASWSGGSHPTFLRRQNGAQQALNRPRTDPQRAGWTVQSQTDHWPQPCEAAMNSSNPSTPSAAFASSDLCAPYALPSSAALNEADMTGGIAMAGPEDTPSEAIALKFGLNEGEVIALVRAQLKTRSFRVWPIRLRMRGRAAKLGCIASLTEALISADANRCDADKLRFHWAMVKATGNAQRAEIDRA